MRGTVQHFQVTCGSLEGNPLGDPTTRTMPVYLPPGYAEAKATRYPVVYFLHAFTGSGQGWLNVSPFTRNVPARLDELVSTEVIPPCIGVFVDGWTSLGGSQWINSEAIGRYRELVAKDVMQWADRTLRTIPKATARALVGHSSGGYGAMVISRFHPDLFGHIAVQSGDSGFELCYLAELPQIIPQLQKAGGVEAWFKDFRTRALTTKMRNDDHAVINMLCMAAAYSPKKGEPLHLELPIDLENGRLRIDVWNRWLVHDPVRFVPKHLDAYKKLRSVFIDCGSRDEFNLRWGARQVVEELKKGGIEVLHEEFDDGHMGVNYRYDRSLSYLVPRLEKGA